MNKKGTCNKCGLNNVNIANSKLMLCPRCNNQRRFLEKKNKQKEDGIQSYTDLYKEIWAERPHICSLTNELLNFDIDTSLWRSCFAHVFAKGKFPQWARLKCNIMLMHPEVHHLYDNGTKEKLMDRIGEKGYKILIKQKKKVLESK